ncbi:MAG TPA: hypothetical protein VM427_04540 [Patescibacteria group bacterium]|nr:hypothetical protein [Patescibacteria group bacterium]
MRRLVLVSLLAALALNSCAPDEPGPSREPLLTYTIVAHGDLFNVYDIHVRKGRPLILRLVNPDAGDWHGLGVRGSDPERVVLEPTTIRGVSEKSFDLGQLPVGIYNLSCPISAGMNATLTVEEAASR